MRIYQDCKLRSPELPPHLVEFIYQDAYRGTTALQRDAKQRDREGESIEAGDEEGCQEGEEGGDEEGQEEDEEQGVLPPEGFVEVILHFASYRYSQEMEDK